VALAGVGAGALAAPALAQVEMPRPTLLPRKDNAPKSLRAFDDARGEYVLPPLPYQPDALEPAIDAKTVEVHHGKHHAAYVAGANKALSELAAIRAGSADAAFTKHWARELSFNLGGHVNHTLFWNMMAPAKAGGGGEPTGTLADAIRKDFGGFDAFTRHFKANAAQVEGNGWGWLVYEPLSGRLLLVQMQNQQDRLVTGGIPILGVDVWEHAYYLKHQNKRTDYIEAFMGVVNWAFCQELLEAAGAR
jgi:Fe-Mn family superoxide dismutase